MTSKESANRGTPSNLVNPVPSTRRNIWFNNRLFLETDYEGYFVSNDGIVISFRPNNGRGDIDLNKQPKILKYGTCGSSRKYYCVICSLGNKKIPKTVHRLVYETFIGTIPSNMTIDHIDGDTHNNTVKNLQLLSPQDNTRKSTFGHIPKTKKNVYLSLDDREYHFNSIGDMTDIIDFKVLQRARLGKFYTKYSKYKIISFCEGATTIEIKVETLRK